MTLDYPKYGNIPIAAGKSPIELKWYQNAAVKELSAKLNAQQSFSGLLVMPTGSGKTITAVYWLLQNVINKNCKLLWIAHRHELLNQALATFHANAYKNVVPDQDGFKYRIISGQSAHDRPVNIQPDDDLIIASKDSLQRRGLDYLLQKWAKGEEEIILVIDEAHHATAKTYRRIIDQLRQNVPRLKILGLTATPIRTSEGERGLLKKVFPDDVIYKIDLKTLIAQGVLAEPTFRETQTHYTTAGQLSAKKVELIKRFDLPKDIAGEMAEHDERNHVIVSEYFRELDKNGGYGPTIVFALNINHAITLEGIFNEWGKNRGIKSAFVVSSIKDMGTGVTISKELNQQRIKDFRQGKIQVLINVLILTEGVDLPQTKTVFLTRPTISSILTTQMIGRALRGPAMGGTQKAYVVSFIDDWQDKIHWVSPESLYNAEADFLDDTREATQRIMRLISIAKVQEFAQLLDQAVDTDALERLPALNRIPLGLYSFTLQNDSHRIVLVYSHHKSAYDALIRDLPQLFKEADQDNNLELSDSELEVILKKVKQRYLTSIDPMLAWRDEDIAGMLRYFGEKGAEPPYLAFEDRGKFDISKLAAEIIERKLDRIAESDYVKQLWSDETTFWRVYYGNNIKYFRRELDLEIHKALDPDLYPLPKLPPPEDLGPPPQPIPRDEVLARDGYCCLCCGDTRRNYLQVDHVVPRSLGGDDAITNLQTLCRTCNGLKGAQEIDFRRSQTPLELPPASFRQITQPHPAKIKNHQAWKQYLRRRVNFFYQCAAVDDVVSKVYGNWRISLKKGNEPIWLQSHLSDWEKETGLRGINLDLRGKQLVPPKKQRKKLSDLPDGTTCRFMYRRKQYNGKIKKGKLAVRRRGQFTTFSGASKNIARTSRNGWKDWELQFPGTTEWILAADWRERG